MIRIKWLFLIVLFPCLAVFLASASSCQDDCESTLLPGSDLNCKFKHDGISRSYLLYAPANYDNSTETALVVDCHGFTETAKAQAGLEGWQHYEAGLGSGYRLVSDREGFIVATPQGVMNLWTHDDVGFVQEVVTKVSAIANIDPDRVYITGISNGGSLNYWTGCEQTTPVFRGFSPVAGHQENPCNSIAEPAPMIAFHSEFDSVIDYNEGRDSAALWADMNNCQNGPYPSMIFGGPNADTSEICITDGPDFELVACDTSYPATTCETWDQCDDGIEVVFCTVPGDSYQGGHILYRNQTHLSLAAVGWEFFERFAQ